MGMYRVRVASQGWTGGPGLNTFYFASIGGGGAPGAQLALDRVKAVFEALKGIYPSQSTFTFNPEVDHIEEANGELTNSWAVDQPATTTGTLTDGYSAIVTMVLMRLRTEGIVNGNRVLGRAFLGPVGRITDADGTPMTAALDIVSNGGDELLDDGFLGPPPVVWSRPVSAEDATPGSPERDGSKHSVTTVVAPNKYSYLSSRRD